jgi:3-oxoadipate enol-lactonase
MRFIELGDLRVHCAVEGPATAPALVFSNSLGSDLTMWDAQASALGGAFRVIRYDTRGHGRSAVTPGPYTIERLARDVVGLLDALDVARAHFCGLSMGGKIGMWLGAHAPERVGKLVLCNTGALIGTAERWNTRIEDVRERGMKGIAPAVIERWFTPAFREREPDLVARTRAMVESTPPEGYIACCAAIRDADQRAELAAVRARTLVIAGRHDPATPPADGRALAEGIPDARYVELEASHLSNVEVAGAFTAELRSFLGS